MLLHKPQVYRHLFFNQEHKSPNEPKGSAARRTKNIFKLCLLLILFEVYIKWNAIDRLTKAKNLQGTAEFLRQYLYLFVICSLGNGIFFLALIFLGNRICHISNFGADFQQAPTWPKEGQSSVGP